MSDKTAALPEAGKHAGFLKANLREYGMLLSLFAIMLFFEIVTDGTLLRPLNPDEHRENKQLSDALTQAKIQLGDRHAEIRMMRVAVDVLTTRALKAEAALKVEQAKTALLWPVATKQTPSDK